MDKNKDKPERTNWDEVYKVWRSRHKENLSPGQYRRLERYIKGTGLVPGIEWGEGGEYRNPMGDVSVWEDSLIDDMIDQKTLNTVESKKAAKTVQKDKPTPPAKNKMMRGGMVTKSKTGHMDFRKGGLILSSVDNRKKKK